MVPISSHFPIFLYHSYNNPMFSPKAKPPVPAPSLPPGSALTPLTDLSCIYPDIEDQLCSRHSILLGKLKHTFNKLYDRMEPSYYIIVKGSAQIIGATEQQPQLSMGLENGVIVLVARTFPQANIYINGNHMDQQLILKPNGQISQGLSQFAQDIEVVFQNGAANVTAQSQLHGGIVYVHANIAQGCYDYKKSMFTALYIASLIINNALGRYTVQQLIGKLSQNKNIDDDFYLQKLFYHYANREFLIIIGDDMRRVSLDPNTKLLFCKLDLGQGNIEYSQSSIRERREDRKVVYDWLMRKYGVRNMCEAVANGIAIEVEKFGAQTEGETQAQIKIEEEGDITSKCDRAYFADIIEADLRELKLINHFSTGAITIEQLIATKWQIDSRLRQIYSEEVIELVESIRDKTKIQSCTIVEGSYLMLCVERRKYTELICLLRQLLHKGELKSKSCVKLEEELVETRWGIDSEIGEKIFASVPSMGIAVFDPTQAIWFD